MLRYLERELSFKLRQYEMQAATLDERDGAAWMTTKISTLPNLPAVVVLNDYESNPTLLADRYWLFLIGKC